MPMFFIACPCSSLDAHVLHQVSRLDKKKYLLVKEIKFLSSSFDIIIVKSELITSTIQFLITIKLIKSSVHCIFFVKVTLKENI